MPDKNAPVPRPEDTRAKVAREGRLWGMSFCCALAGALTVWATGKLLPGIGVFMLCVVVLGGTLMWYERRHRR